MQQYPGKQYLHQEKKFLLIEETLPEHLIQSSQIIEQYIVNAGPTKDIYFRKQTIKGENSWEFLGIIKDRNPPETITLYPLKEQEYLDGAEGAQMIKKTRHFLNKPYDFVTVDEFKVETKSCYLAEIEGDEEFFATIELPKWLGLEVTQNQLYHSRSISQNGFPVPKQTFRGM